MKMNYPLGKSFKKGANNSKKRKKIIESKQSEMRRTAR